MMQLTASGILGDSALYNKLSLVTELLCLFIRAGSRVLTLEQLAGECGRPSRDVLKYCRRMCAEGLLVPVQGRRSWVLDRTPSEVTLEDAFRCAMTMHAGRPRVSKAGDSPDSMPREVDLLLMQATMGINQSVLHQLRRFSLDRLRTSLGGLAAK